MLKFDVFLSHNSIDKSWVIQLKDDLGRYGVSVWLDHDEIRPGDLFARALEQGLANSQAMALIVSPETMASGWVEAEYYRALSLAQNKPSTFQLIPVILREAELPGFLQDRNWIDFRDESTYAEKVRDLVWGITGQKPANVVDLTAPSPSPVAARDPYRGLSAFREEDAEFFFGRETFTTQLVESVQQKALVAVLGPSGSGKSSIVFAGLLPHLRRQGAWLIVPFRPGREPFRALAAALLPFLELDLTERLQLKEINGLASDLQQGELTLAQVVTRILEKSSFADRFLLVADQFEELYTLSEPETQQTFIDTLLRAHPLVPQLHLTLTLRADFLAQALDHRLFADVVQDGIVTLGPMTPGELRQVIEKPAETQGVTFQPSLVDRILSDVGDEPGYLPLLEFALTALWEQQSQGELTHAVYEAIGRVEGALSHHADQVLANLSPAELEQARRILIQLVNPGANTEDTRRLATRSELEKDWPLVSKLASERLVVTNQVENKQDTVELVHEALISHWKQLRTWIDEDREFRTWQERLRAAMRQWQADQRDEGALLRGAPLAAAAEKLVEHPKDLTEAEQKFINASLEQQRRQERQRKYIVAGFIVVAIIMAILAIIALDRSQAATRALADTNIALEKEATARADAQVRQATAEAASTLAIEQEAKAQLEATRALNAQATAQAAQASAEANELAANARTLLETDPELSILLLKTIPVTPTSQVGSLLQQAIQTSRIRGRFTLTHQVGSVAFSPQGDHLAAGDHEGQVKIWEVTSGQEVMSVTGQDGEQVWGVSFSPDGAYLAVVGANDTVEIWDIASGQLMARKQGHSDTVRDVDLCSERQTGTLIATASEDKTIKIWSLEEDEALMILQGHSDDVASVAFGPNCNRLVSASHDRAAIVWDVASGMELLKVTGHDGILLDTAFSPDGIRFATSSEDRTVKIWDSASGEALLTLPETSAARGIAFSPDGTQLVTANVDGIARTWNVRSGRSRLTFAGHKDNVQDVVFSPNGTQLATASWDGSVRIWDASGHGDVATDVAFSPDGNWLATTGWDGVIRIWQIVLDENDLLVDIRELSRPISANNSPIRRVAFSPDGSWLATASHDGLAKIWPWSPGPAENSITRETLSIPAHTDRVQGVAFSLMNGDPNQMRLATTSYDETAKIWHLILNPEGDSATSQRLYTLEGHENWVNEVAFSPDGNLLATASSDHTAVVWDAGSGQPLHTLDHPGIDLGSVSFSPDGTRLATAGIDGTAKVWDIGSGKELFSLEGHTNWVRDITFSPDGAYLATAGFDKTTRVWQANTGQIVIILNNDTQVESVAFSPDGNLLATTNGDGTLHFYPWNDSEALQTLARHRVTRSLSSEECQMYLHQEKC